MKITKDRNSIIVEYTDQEMIVLEDSLINPLSWLETLAGEKLANVKSRLIDTWTKKLQISKAVATIPTDEEALLALIFAQPDYKNKAARDAEMRR